MYLHSYFVTRILRACFGDGALRQRQQRVRFSDVFCSARSRSIAETMGSGSSCAGRRFCANASCRDRTAVIRKLSNDLIDTVDVHHGLIDLLFSRSVLTNRQIENIKSRPTDFGRVKELLDCVARLDADKQEMFLVTLEKTQQRHVSNFIRMNGRRSATDDWPLTQSRREVETLDRLKSKLIELIDPRNGLLQELFSVGCINSRQKQKLEIDVMSDAERNELLLDILRRRSVADYYKFVRCLTVTKQHHVVSLLVPEVAAGARPLSDECKSKLRANYGAMIDAIDTKSGHLLPELLSAGCITWRQKHFVESATSQAESNSRLLDIVKRGSQSDFDKFVRCLEKTGQEHVGRMLLNNASVTLVIAETRCGCGGSSSDEERLIVERFMALLRGSSNAEVQYLYAKVTRQVNELWDGGDMQVIGANTRHSIGLFFQCKSVSRLQRLYELYSSGQLVSIVEDMFNALLNGDQPVRVTSLNMNMSEYAACMQYLMSSMGLSVLSDVYRLPQRNNTILPHDVKALFQLNYLPNELLELILLKTARLHFQVLSKLLANAEVCTLVTLCSVSLSWWRTLSYRIQNSKLLVKSCFHLLSLTALSSPKWTAGISVGGDQNVTGISEFDGRLYVVCHKLNTVKVFSRVSPFEPVKIITVEGMHRPTDIVAGRNRLHVVDCELCAIWRVTHLLSKCQVDRCVATPSSPWSLSVTSGRLLVTSRDGDALFVYADDGDDVKMLSLIKLPYIMLASHAVATSRHTYVVCHRNRHSSLRGSADTTVTELDVSGRAIRTLNSRLDAFGCSLPALNRPYYVAFDSDGHVIVADRSDECIVLLTSDLQMERIITASLGGPPIRMCLSQDSSFLFVASVQSTVVRAYRFRHRHRKVAAFAS